MAGDTSRTEQAQYHLKEYLPGAAEQRIGNYIGLAMKAGKVAAGDMAATKALQKGQTHLLLLALDTAPKTAAGLIALAEERRLPLLWWAEKTALGLLVGKSKRGALAIMDAGFAAAILKLCQAKETVYTVNNDNQIMH